MGNRFFVLLLVMLFSISCFAQDITLRTQAEVDQFDINTTFVQGFLMIGSPDSDIIDLTNLSNVEQITGRLYIKENPLLEVAEFPALVRVNQDVHIENNPTLETLDLGNVALMTGNLTIKDDDLKEIKLTSLESIGGLFELLTPSLQSLSLPKLVDVAGDFGIEECNSIEVFEAPLLSQVDGFFVIAETPQLEIIDLPELVSVDEYFTIRESQNLIEVNLDKLERVNSRINLMTTNLNTYNFPSLKSIAGLHLYDNTMMSFDMPIIENCNSLYINNNSALRNLDGLSNLKFCDGDVDIKYNGLLENLNGLTNITRINGDLDIDSNEGLQTINLAALTHVGGKALLSANQLRLISLASLETIVKDLNINTSPNLISIQFPELTSVQDIQMGAGNSATHIDFAKLKNIDRHMIVRYSELESLEAFSQIETIGGNLQVDRNDYLTDCCVIQRLILTPGAVAGMISIFENNSGCDSELEVADAICGLENIAKGKIQIDLNDNGCDANDISFNYANLEVIKDNESIGYILNQKGEYRVFLSTEGNYEFIPHLGDYFEPTPKNLLLNNPQDLSNLENDFCVSPIGDIKDLRIDIIPLNNARPGFEAYYKIIYQNIGTTLLSGSVLLDYDGAHSTYSSGEPEPDIVEADFLQWDFDVLLPLERGEIILGLLLNTPQDNPPLNDGDEIRIELKVLPFDEDASRPNNFALLKQSVVNSQDPNDKTCLQGDYILKDSLGNMISYLVRFENIGTASAVNILVEDRIDPTVYDISTLKVLDASHEVQTQIRGDSIRFSFEEIYLPFEDAENDGHVYFEIKPKDGLVVGDAFENTADIYFDFNEAITTNTAISQIVIDNDQDGFHNLEDCDDDNHQIYPGAEEIAGNGIDEDCDGDDLSSTINVGDGYIKIFPNPVSNILMIETHAVDISSASIFDNSGKQILNCNACNSFNISHLAAGSYILRVMESASNQYYSLPVIIH